MFVRPFQYLTVDSVEEASTLLAQHDGEAKLLAGGQSLMPMINLGLVQVEALIDISRIPNLDGITADSDSLQLGALARYHTIERDFRVQGGQPLLTEAIRHVGNPRVRNLGTIGGSLVHCDPAAELPLIMQVMEAECAVSNGRETRTIPAADFFLSYFTTALRDDEILVSIHVPKLLDGWGWGFHEFAVRAGDFALVAAATVACCREGTIESIRIGLAGVGERAVRLPEVERAAQGHPLDRLNEALALVAQAINPPDDPLASAVYRRHLATVLAGRAVRDACRRSEGNRA